jgi:AcrR family transcriptional regulator
MSPRRRAAAPAVDMETKTQPLQDRSRATFDAILKAAGELLEEVGIEKFSTNLVCRRANLTPPALYRYFPNKYALLKELSQRLMGAQDVAVYAWIDTGGLAHDETAAMAEQNLAILRQVIEVSAAFPGGLWILRAMRAVPLLRDVRLASTTTVADRIFASLRERYRETDPERLRRAAWLTTEVSNAVIEMVLEGAHSDPEAVLAEACWMMARYYAGFR